MALTYARMDGLPTIHIMYPDYPGRSYCNRPYELETRPWVECELPPPDVPVCKECAKRRAGMLKGRRYFIGVWAIDGQKYVSDLSVPRNRATEVRAAKLDP